MSDQLIGSLAELAQENVLLHRRCDALYRILCQILLKEGSKKVSVSDVLDGLYLSTELSKSGELHIEIKTIMSSNEVH